MSVRGRYSVRSRVPVHNSNLERWETSIRNFKKSIDICDKISEDCSQLLSSFEKIVKPLKETTQLLHTQIKNSSLVVNEFDKVIEYQTVASKYSTTIKNGPDTGKSKDYLFIVEKLVFAKEFLSKYAPTSDDIQILEELLTIAGDKLESDIQKRLLLTSKALSPSLINEKISFLDHYDDAVRDGNFSGIDFAKYENFLRDHDNSAEFEDLALVAKYLQNSERKTFDFFNFYTEVRCGSVLQGLHGLKELCLKNLGNNTTIARLQNINKSVINKFNRYKTLSKSNLREDSKVEEPQMVNEEMFFYVNRMVAAMVFLTSSEKRLISAIIDEENQTNALVTIFTALLEKCSIEIEGMVDNSQKLCLKDDLLLILGSLTCLLPVLKFMYMFRSQFDFLIKTTMIGTRRKLNGLTETIEMAVDSIIDIFGTKSKELLEKSSPDYTGNIHEHTSNSVAVLIGLIKYKDVLNYRFAASKKQHESKKTFLYDVKELNFPNFWERFTKFLLSLQDNLQKFSENYTDDLTKCVFLLNNYDYVIQKLKLIDETEPGIDSQRINTLLGEYSIYINVECEAFEDCWIKMIASLTTMKTDFFKYAVDYQKGKSLGAKAKKQIKLLFKQFNTDLGNMLEQTNTLVHSNEEQCSKLAKKVNAIVLPVYDLCYQSFKNVPFAKNTDKYIIHTKESLSEAFKAMFEKIPTKFVSRKSIKLTKYIRRKA